MKNFSMCPVPKKTQKIPDFHFSVSIGTLLLRSLPSFILTLRLSLLCLNMVSLSFCPFVLSCLLSQSLSFPHFFLPLRLATFLFFPFLIPSSLFSSLSLFVLSLLISLSLLHFPFSKSTKNVKEIDSTSRLRDGDSFFVFNSTHYGLQHFLKRFFFSKKK